MTDDPGVSLAHYLTHPGCGVRFICSTCQGGHTVPVADVIARLEARGLGGAETGVREVARFAERACGRCGWRRWETRPDFPLE